jgi:hypothetical protein
MAADVEMVVVARPSAASRPFRELVDDMRKLADSLERAVRGTRASG